VSMAPDGRVNLQAVRKAAGLPDVLPVAQWPGLAGSHAELAQGAEVLVEFIEGDRTMPIVTRYVGKDGPGFVPVSVSLCGGESPVARVGDFVDITIPAGVIIPGFNSGGGPFTVSPPGLRLIGFIQSGAAKVKA
jgi:hypothetical protein